jgi:hypothetical protein
MTSEVVFPLRDGGTRIEVEIRSTQPGDRNLILSSFCRSLRNSSFTAGCPSETFYPAAAKCAETMLARWEVLVATVAGAPDEIAGWLSFRRDDHGITVGFAYTKHPYRGFKVASKLLEAAGVRPGMPFAVVFGRAGALRAFRDRGFQIQQTPFVCFELMEVV